MRLLCPSTEKKDKILSAHNQIDTGNLLSNVLRFQAKVFVIQWTRHVAIQESDKSSRLTGRTLCVSKKLLYTICDVGHPHEMVFIEPSHVFLDEMVGDQDDRLAFEHQSLPGVSEIAVGVGTLLSQVTCG